MRARSDGSYYGRGERDTRPIIIYELLRTRIIPDQWPRPYFSYSFRAPGTVAKNVVIASRLSAVDRSFFRTMLSMYFAAHFRVGCVRAGFPENRCRPTTAPPMNPHGNKVKE